MTPNELYYNCVPKKIVDDLWEFPTIFSDSIPLLTFVLEEHEDEKGMVKQKRILLKIMDDVDFDGYRGSTLKTFWFDGEPFMIHQSAGRDNSDFQNRIITNKEVYFNAVLYLIHNYMGHDIVDPQEFSPPTRNIEDLACFYGYDHEKNLDVRGKK
jgi:hypothetical protein